jgi:DNA polymerase-1
VDEKQLSVQKGIDDQFLKLYFDYKGAVKNVTSYGQTHLNLINPNTGRLHTEFKQIGTVTGRMSSGSNAKNRDLAKLKNLPADEVGFVNLQNLPARGEYGKIARACFTATEGNVFVSCDYSAEESRVQADVWNEKTLLDAFANGIDTHNLYAKMCFPDELKNVDVKDVKAQRPDLRQLAKICEFSVGYGSNGASMASVTGMPVEKCMEMVSGILKGMPGMAFFKKKAGQFLKENGYIVINKITGHRVYWPEWASWKAVEDRFDRQFWEDYRTYHQGTGDEVAQMVKKHMQEGHDWFGKNVLNYPIQGGSAIVLKQAAADLFDWVVNNGYFGKILFCVFVHDEICAECPETIADLFIKKLEATMEGAAAKFYKKLRIPAEASVATYWLH